MSLAKQRARIATERMERLFELAEQELDRDPELSCRWVALARRISMRTRVRIPAHLKRGMCKGCHCLLVVGKSARVRLKEGRVCITCLRCGRVMRYPYDRDIKTKESEGS
ncbi:MAG: ribonuclease P protein component 4 [Methermicoccaceae archaeon]